MRLARIRTRHHVHSLPQIITKALARFTPGFVKYARFVAALWASRTTGSGSSFQIRTSH